MAKGRKQKTKKKSPKQYKEIIAIGDLHGDYPALIELLTHADLIDEDAHWRGGKTILIQVGDVVDRGPEPEKVDDYLEVLTKEAKKTGGKVIRLIGNHELEILKRHFAITTLEYEDIEKYYTRLKNNVLASKMLAAYASQGFLFTHAGVSGPLQEVLAKELNGKKVTPSSMANLINSVFLKSVSEDDFSHPIFNIGRKRGGSKPYGGVFWEDITSFLGSGNPYKLKQVFGHTPITEVAQNKTGDTFAIDVGLFSGYGGRRGYLRISGGKGYPVNIPVEVKPIMF